MDSNKDNPLPLNYATPQKGRQTIYPVNRVLIGILAMFFLLPALSFIRGVPASDRPVSDAIGIAVTLSFGSALAFFSFTGRFRFRRPENPDDGNP